MHDRISVHGISFQEHGFPEPGLQKIVSKRLLRSPEFNLAAANKK